MASGISFLLANLIHRVQTAGISAAGVCRGRGVRGKIDGARERRPPF